MAIVEPIKNLAHGLAEATSEFLEDSTLGSPLPNYAYNEKKVDETKANLAEKIVAAPHGIVAGVAEGTADFLEDSTIGQPIPNYAYDEKKVEQDKKDLSNNLAAIPAGVEDFFKEYEKDSTLGHPLPQYQTPKATKDQ